MTQFIEYRNMDKTDWERGPWDDEPDKVQWQDEATGLPCLIKRNDHGALCGYVGVPAEHPWHGQGYENCERADGDYVEVHGGLTYAAGCSHKDDPAQGICHIPAEGEPDNVWWLGFDCCHAWDKSNMARDAAYREKWPDFGDEVYRDIAYVRSEVTNLAAQAAEVGART